MKKYFAIILVIAFGLFNNMHAQASGGKKPMTQWWLGSSLADSTRGYLFHIEGQYSYSKMSGPIEGEMQSGGLRSAIRINTFTNHIDYSIDKMNLKIQMLRMQYTTESHRLIDYLDFDITRLLYAETGFIWERDNTIFIKNRYSMYAGTGLNGLIAEKHYLKLLVAMGRISPQYSIPVDHFDVVKVAYQAFYLRQHYSYVLDRRFTLLEDAYYFTNMNTANRYMLGVNLNLNIGIVDPVSLVLGYSYKFDREAELLGAIPKNTNQSIGLLVSL
ncbi:MAG TPA: DUF481 domain-containing protein [Ignavibacteriales bacterium]|nr:DUF481 domain-containing protein [Ignavibacteriales bacterium]